MKSGKPQPFRCRDCGKYFSLKTGTLMEDSKLPLRKWGWAIYLEMTGLKGVSSMKLHRDIGVTQKTAWFMLHRIRAALEAGTLLFGGPIEIDETFVGGLEKNKPQHKRLKAGRGPVGKTAVVGAKDRETNQVVARVIEATDKATLNSFEDAHADSEATVYTDGSSAYKSRKNHESVKHSVGEYVRGMVPYERRGVLLVNAERGYHGVYHKISTKHLQRYVNEFFDPSRSLSAPSPAIAVAKVRVTFLRRRPPPSRAGTRTHATVFLYTSRPAHRSFTESMLRLLRPMSPGTGAGACAMSIFPSVIAAGPRPHCGVPRDVVGHVRIRAPVHQ